MALEDTPRNQAEIKQGGSDGKNHPQLNSVDILADERLSRAPGKFDLPPESKEPPIGVAVLKDKETIVLHLKGKSGGTIGEAEVEYQRGDLYYDDIFKHLGGIKKGESKDIAPWPDDQKTANSPRRAQVIGPQENGKEPPKDLPKDLSKDLPKDLSKDLSKDLPKTAEKDPVKDQTVQPPGQTTDQSGKPAVADIVLPPSSQFSTLVTDTYAKMSLETHDILSGAHTTITATHRLTDALPELKGQKPRGWPPGLTWDAVDGAYSPSRNTVVVAEETENAAGQWVKSYRTADVARHEVGHATDYGLGKLSSTPAFVKAYEDDTQNMPAPLAPALKYFLQNGDGGKEEACAEAIASREGGSTSGKAFDSGFARTITAVNEALLARRATLTVGTTLNSQPPVTTPAK